MAFIKSSNLYFSHIPKCGGTTIERCLNLNRNILGQENSNINLYTYLLHKISTYKNEYLKKQTNQKILFCSGTLKIYLQHLTPSEAFSLQLIPNNYQKKLNILTVTRNPCSRFLSSYNYFNLQKKNINADNVIEYLIDKKNTNDYSFSTSHLMHFRPQELYFKSITEYSDVNYVTYDVNEISNKVTSYILKNVRGDDLNMNAIEKVKNGFKFNSSTNRLKKVSITKKSVEKFYSYYKKDFERYMMDISAIEDYFEIKN